MSYNKNKGKIIGFRSDVITEKKLNKHTFDYNITKKDWLENNLEKGENQALHENKKSEKWVKIPASEYNYLIVDPEKHSGFVCDRIVAHVRSQGKELTFDNLWFEFQTFHKLNDIECTRIKEGKSDVIFCNHNMGMNTSLFLCYLTLDMVNITPNYQFESKIITEKTFMIKIKLTKLDRRLNQHVQNQELTLTQLNQIKKENPEQRKLQNKRYREKNSEILNLKKQLTYHKKKHNAALI